MSEAETAVSRGPDLPMKWAKFWTYVHLPLGAVNTMISTPHDAGVPIGIAMLVVAYGLYTLRRWGWWANWVYLVASCWTLVQSAIYRTGYAETMVIAIASLFVVLIWGVPNYVYFSKRKHIYSL